MVILDKLAAKTAQRIIDERGNNTEKSTLDGLSTKTIGVLQEQGVYAAVLFLLSRFGSEQFAKVLMSNLLRLLNEDEVAAIGAAFPLSAGEVVSPDWVAQKKERVLKHFADGTTGSDGIATNLQRLLVVRSLFEQTLIYVRYGAKAL